MARNRKEDAPAKGSPAWMATFSDLMNLLLCFFVLLFAMSSVDEDKFEQLVASLSASFGVMEGGSTSVIEGTLISSGVNDLNELNEYYESLGMSQEGDADSMIQSLSEGEQQELLEMLEEQKYEEMLQESEEMAEFIEQMAKSEGIAGQLEIDFTAQYVQITLNGALLFDPAMPDVRKDAMPFMNKVGNILKNYSSNMIEITGHTDTVPLLDDPKYDDNWDLSSARAKSVMMYLVKEKGLDIKKMKAAGRGEYEPIASNETNEGRAQNRRVEIKIYNEFSGF